MAGADDYASPTGLLRLYFLSDADVVLETGGRITAGAVETAEHLSEGGLILTEVGAARAENYQILRHPRIQLTCTGPTPGVLDRVARVVMRSIDRFSRRGITDPAAGKEFVVHVIRHAGGPSDVRDPVKDMVVKVLFVEMMIGADAV